MKSIRHFSIDISRKLNSIPEKMTDVLNTTTSEMLEEVKANANYKTGTFVESFYQIPATSDGKKVVSSIGNSLVVHSLQGNSYNLGYLLENGTRPHDIFPLRANALRFTIDGKTVYAKEVHHPGTHPYLFYYNALENAKPRLGRRVSQAIREELNKW